MYVTASKALDRLLAAAASQGIDFGINGAYRTYNDQVVVKRRYGNDAAVPGTSNHGFGLAVDFTDSNLTQINTRMREYTWLKANANKYGFRRLPWGSRGEDWEAWHWEYQNI